MLKLSPSTVRLAGLLAIICLASTTVTAQEAQDTATDQPQAAVTEPQTAATPAAADTLPEPQDAPLEPQPDQSATPAAPTPESIPVAASNPQEIAAQSREAPVNAQALPDIVVTSEKSARTMLEVPASVSSVDGDALRKADIHSLAQVQDYVPNVTLALNHTAATFAVRGFATPDTNPGFDPSVGAVIDGVYYGRSQFINAFFFDIDRVEVLRGPQGTLFGKNSTAGVLNLVTAPAANEFLASAEFKRTSFNQHDILPVLQLPLGDRLSLRYSGNYSHGDRGTVYNTKLQRNENNPQSNSSRVRLSYIPDGPVTMDIEAYTSRELINNNGFQFTVLTPKMEALLKTYDPRIDGHEDRYNSADFPSASDGTNRGINTTLTYDVSGSFGIPQLSVTTIISVAQSLTAKKDLDADFSPVNFIDNQLIGGSTYKQATDEVRLSGEGETVLGFGHGYNFITGAFLSNSRFTYNSTYNVENLGAAAAYCNATANFCGIPVPLPPGGSPISGDVGGMGGQTLGQALDIISGLSNGAGAQNAVVNLNQRGRSYALFGQFEFFFTQRWALIGGLRYGDEIKDALSASQSDSQLIKAITSQKDHSNLLHIEEVDYSPKAGVKWELDKRTSAYLTFSRGYKSGGFNALPLSDQNLSYQPEQATSIELGAKAKMEDFLGGPMRINAAIFHTRFDNLQVSTFLNGNFLVLNAASAVTRGFDVDLHWLPPVTGVSITSALGFSDARYLSYRCAPATAGNQVQNANQECVGDKAQTQDLSGKRLSFGPRVTASLIPAYQLPVEAIPTVIALDILYRGNRYLDVDLDPNKLQPATTIFNTRITLESPTRRWGLSLVAHNLTDKLLADQAISQPLAPGNVLVYRADYGRYYSGNLRIQF